MQWEDEADYRLTVSRRDLGRLGFGLVFLLFRPSAVPGQPIRIASRVLITADGTVTLMTGKVELGQGPRTSMTQVVAEELRVAPSGIRVLMGDTALVPDDGGTWASLTTPQTIPAVQAGCAAARGALEQIAARRWGVPTGSVRGEDGAVVHETQGRITYAELTQGSPLEGDLPQDVPVTPARNWKVCGTSLPAINGPAIVTGSLKYASDQKVAGMRHGKILRPPGARAKLRAFKGNAVRDGDCLGVVADGPEAAAHAAESVKADWSVEPVPVYEELYAQFKAKSIPPKPGEGGRYPALVQRGSVADGLAASVKRLEARYTLPYIAHVPLETRAAIAEWKGNNLTVWSGPQAPFLVRKELSEAFKIPEENVRVIASHPGGAFGGKQRGECELEAARLAKAAGAPVRVAWSREEEFTCAYVRPAGVIEVTSGLSPEGRVHAWHFRNYNSGSPGIPPVYAIPHYSCEFHRSQSPLRQGSYRSLACVANTFARESHIDELAEAAATDPVAFRLRNIDDARLKEAIERGAERFGWGRRKGALEGMSCNLEKDSRLALFLELDARAPAGRPRLRRMVAVFDVGAILNPDGLKNQLQGGLIQGIGGALFEKLVLDKNGIGNAKLSQYRVPRFADTPDELDVILVDRREIASAGAGEAPITVVAPAIASALHRATGKRHRDLPLA